MADIEFYKNELGISTVDALCQRLCETCIETNHTYDFFVDWTKVIRNRNAYKYELALLKSLHGSKEGVTDLKGLISHYPEVAKVIPLLLACREGILKVLDALDPVIRYKTISFTKNNYMPVEIDDIVEFTQKSGLLTVLTTMESATDYLLGVEVGLDSNARKNRSGTFLENIVREALQELAQRNHEIVWVEQKYFNYFESHYGIPVPPTLRNRKVDFAIIYQGKATNIEVNFYGGTGSKPSEIVSSYTNRCEVLTSKGWKFVWLTDGEGWKDMMSPLRVGVEGICYVINVSMLRNKIIDKIILR